VNLTLPDSETLLHHLCDYQLLRGQSAPSIAGLWVIYGGVSSSDNDKDD
jgi:hypothetical protein